MIALLESILHFLTALLDLAGDFVTGVGLPSRGAVSRAIIAPMAAPPKNEKKQLPFMISIFKS